MSPSFICRLLLVATAMLPPCSAAAAELWYDPPARTWMTQALPLGNGGDGANQAFGDLLAARRR